MSEDPFDSAERYDCLDSETLTHETPEEAVEAWADQWMEQGIKQGSDAVALIRQHAPCTIKAYRRQTVDESWIRSQAEYQLDQLAEKLSEDYGDPNGDSSLTDDDTAACLPAMMQVVRDLIGRATVWYCEFVGQRLLSGKQVEDMMREHRPDWFETNEPARAPSENSPCP